MADGYRWSFGLAMAATVSCFVAGAWMSTFPMMSGGRYPTVGEALAMVSVPAAVSAFGSWAAWRGRRGWLIAATLVVGLFAVITGFSIGSAFHSAFVLLAWAVIASIDAGPAPESGDS